MARRIWHGCPAGLRDTPVAAYLAGRGIDLGELRRAPGALRYHPRLWHAPSRRHCQAMVATISGLTGQLPAAHRTWLDHRDGRWNKVSVENAKTR